MRDNPGALAAFMLRLIDESPDRLAIISVPSAATTTDDDIDALEAVFIRECERAKADRPDLSVKAGPPPAGRPDVAMRVAVHEHQWIGGQCVRGCGDELQGS